MNTQRPEWNDANNALAGWGVSMVTLSYLLRFIDIFDGLLDKHAAQDYELHGEVLLWFERSSEVMGCPISSARISKSPISKTSISKNPISKTQSGKNSQSDDAERWRAA